MTDRPDATSLQESYDSCQRISAFYSLAISDGLGSIAILLIGLLYLGYWKWSLLIMAAYIVLLMSIQALSKRRWQRHDSLRRELTRMSNQTVLPMTEPSATPPGAGVDSSGP